MATSLSLEGLEYNGKSSLSYLVSHNIADTTFFPTTFLCEPGGTPLGATIRAILKTDEFKGMHPITSLLLFSASRSEVLENRIKPWEIENPNGITIADRCWLSSLAYQNAEGAPMSYIRKVQEPFMGYPGLIALIDLLPEEGLVRRKALKGEREEDWRDRQSIDGLVKVRSNYLNLYEEFKDRMVLVDGFSGMWEMVLAFRNLALGRLALDPRYTTSANRAIRDHTGSDLEEWAKFENREHYEGFQEQLIKQEEVRSKLGIESKSVLRQRMLDEWKQRGFQGLSF
jgi:dTMP kinase